MYYYKKQTERELGLLCLEEPLSPIPEGYVELTQEQYDAELQALNPAPSSVNEIMHQIVDLKQQLIATDYKAIKYAEGWISEEDYAPIKAQRQAIRDEINRLKEEIENQ